MANRMISYGYGMQDGRITVIDREAEIVRRIFFEYINGKLLDEIATELTEEKVDFYLGKCEWNKSRIKRILENEKYVGADHYPQIVNDDDFIKAGEIKDDKGAKKLRFEEHIEYLRNNKVTCAQCGGHFKRISKWRSREKWMCRQGCKNSLYVDDGVLLSSLLTVADKVASNPEIVTPITEDKASSLEIRRCTSEVNRIFSDKAPNFAAGKKLIFHLAEVKFALFDEKTPDAYTDMIVVDCERVVAQGKVNRSFLEKYCDQIKVAYDGSLSVRFINGAELTSEEV